ncbi:hypothetical protein [Candidatus Phytoplasma gossypii]|uniref:Transmembrane protein n=1 Tax=Candidatus Phytoplasma gossypii TaxID=2982629 RepID=A0ABT9D1M9_9MOLU|nr:hypothetical protein ['Gossypium sp.' phytoplasma]MDO8057584.1 hypothetical protein ['Gossypium sp.' phytoplasma]
MFEKSMQNKIIKLLITFFLFFLLFNIFLIIFFNMNNNINKSKLFSNKQINKSANLKINNISLSSEEQKLIFIDSNVISPDEIIAILKERIINEFLERNKIAKAFELAKKDLDINFKISNNLSIQDEEKFIKELIKIDPQITLKDDIIEELNHILLKEYRKKNQLLAAYEFFVNYKLIHNKIRNSHIYQINELYKNPQIQNIKYPFYTIVLKFILEDKEKEIVKSKEQLKTMQAHFNYYNVIEKRITNEKEFENNLIAIDSQSTYQQNLLILKERIKNQFKEKNKLAKLYDQIRIEIELSALKPEEKLYIQNEEDYINNSLFTSVNMPTSEEKILEHFQKILLLEYQNKKNILNLYNSYLQNIINIMLDTTSNNFITWSPTKIGLINKIINNPLFTIFLRLKIEDAQNEIMNLKKQMKDIPATLNNLENTKNELQNYFQNQLKNYFITYDRKINDLKDKIEILTKINEKHEENDQKQDESILDFDKRLQTLSENDLRHDENDQKQDESILDFDKRLQILSENDRRHDENDQKQDESILDFDKRLQTLSENDRRHDENDQKQDESILDFDKRLQTLSENDRRQDKSFINFDQSLKTLTKNYQKEVETDQKQNENIKKFKNKVANFKPIHTTLNEDKYQMQETSATNIINLNYKNPLIKEKNKNNQIFQKDNILSETNIEFLPYQNKNKILKKQQLSLFQKLIKLVNKYLTNIYSSINVQTWTFLFKKYSQIYLLIILCIMNILFYLLLSNNLK